MGKYKMFMSTKTKLLRDKFKIKIFTPMRHFATVLGYRKTPLNIPWEIKNHLTSFF